VYYIASIEEPVMMEWFNLIKKQMSKIATQYQMAQRGVGFMKSFRKSMSGDIGDKRRSIQLSGGGPGSPGGVIPGGPGGRHSLALSAPAGLRVPAAGALPPASAGIGAGAGAGASGDDGALSPMMMELSKVFQVLDAMGIKDEDIWDGKEHIYPVLRHFSQEIFAAATIFPINIVSFFFPEEPEFHGVTRKGYKVDKRMPVQRVR
jgi:hypothetical protein